MITLNSSKGLTRISTFEEMTERPGFLTTLVSENHELDAVIGNYQFQTKIQCGLSSCKTPHLKGYVVSTKDGHETNMGQVCGKRYFGVEFQIMANRFDKELEAQENREYLWDRHLKLPELEEVIRSRRRAAKGADWVHRHGLCLVTTNPRCPVELVRIVSHLVKSRSPEVTVETLLTEQEAENREGLQGKKLPRPQYKTEFVSNLLGIEALYPENDLRTILIYGLEEKAKQFKSLKIDDLSPNDLTKWRKWAVGIEEALGVAATSIKFGQLLLTSANLSPLAKLLNNQKDKILFKSFIEGLNAT